MKVFLSWSGDKSKYIAAALRKWLPNVIQQVDAWMSDEDINKGSRWAAELSTQLEKTNFGVICLTPENTDSNWMLYETGALAKQILDSHVVPYLTGLVPNQITGPYTLFQMAVNNRDGTAKLVNSVNQATNEKALPASIVKSSFDKWWPDLEKDFNALNDWREDNVALKRSTDSILDEILVRVREFPREFISQDGFPATASTNKQTTYEGHSKGYYLGQMFEFYELMAKHLKVRPSLSEEEFIQALTKYDYLFLRDLRDIFSILPTQSYELALQYLEDFLHGSDLVDGPSFLAKARLLV